MVRSAVLPCVLATLAISASVNTYAGPITYNLNPVYQNITSFSYGKYASGTWSVTGTITTDGETASEGTAIGADPGHLRDSHGDFLAYNITVANADLGLTYQFQTETTLNFHDDGDGLWYSGSAPVYAWASSTGDLLLGQFNVMSKNNSPANSMLSIASHGLAVYDYAVNDYVFASFENFGEPTPYSFIIASTNFGPAASSEVPEPGSLALMGLGILGAGVARASRRKK